MIQLTIDFAEIAVHPRCICKALCSHIQAGETLIQIHVLRSQRQGRFQWRNGFCRDIIRNVQLGIRQCRFNGFFRRRIVTLVDGGRGIIQPSTMKAC